MTGEPSFTYNKNITNYQGLDYKFINKKMSKDNFEKSLKKELRVLNEIIDMKIVRGLSYASEAKRHKVILNSLANIKRTKSGWMLRSFSLV